MTAVKRFFDRIMLLDLFAGLGITFRHMWKKKVTVQYPEERMEPAHRFRGMFRLDEDRCIKCTLCARDCPIDIVYIDWHQEVNPVTEKKEKVLEEACPTEPKSIWLTSKTYELASYERWQNLYVDIDELQDWQVRPQYTDREVV
jgi:formate hydrogenlyase subunit 6/NADH:ubiquinone oxidoreductase subunit I